MADCKNRIYLDNAATTPMDTRVIEAMTEAMHGCFGNPSSIHDEGRQAKTHIEKARRQIAKHLNVSPGEIFFTSGGTEADNWAITCAVRDLGAKHIITSRIEHHAVLHTAQHCAGAQVHYVDLMPNGHVSIESLKSILAGLKGEKVLVSLMHANNEIGNITPVGQVGEICKKYGALFHCDMVQTIGHLPIDLRGWGVHFTAAAAHKFNGPKGAGFIFVDSSAQLKPLLQGGAQERNMRAGTENLYGIIGLAKAMEIAYAEMEEQSARIQSLKTLMASALREEIPGLIFNGDHEGQSLYTVLSVGIPPHAVNEMLIYNLDIEGIAVSGGSACSSGSAVGSHVIAELDFPAGYAPLRFSFGKFNTPDEIHQAVAVLKSILKIAEPVSAQ